MGATAWWAAWNALEYLAPDLPLKLVFANLEYLAIAAIPVLWFVLGSSLAQEERAGTARRPPLVIWIVPAATAVLVWTDPSLGFVRHSFRLEVESGFTVIAKEFGPWFWVHSAYSYIFIIVGTVLILRALHASRGTRRAQRITLVVGTLLPVAANLVYLSGIFPLGSVDPTPLAFSLTGLLAVLNLTRFRFLALVTTAQATAIEQLQDAVLILDRDGHLAYANARGPRLLRDQRKGRRQEADRDGPALCRPAPGARRPEATRAPRSPCCPTASACTRRAPATS